jgi:hypothetical protein
MTRSRTKQSEAHWLFRERYRNDMLTSVVTVPIEWTEIPFPVKALKIILSDLRSHLGEKADAHPTDEFLAVDSDDDVCLILIILRNIYSTSTDNCN